MRLRAWWVGPAERAVVVVVVGGAGARAKGRPAGGGDSEEGEGERWPLCAADTPPTLSKLLRHDAVASGVRVPAHGGPVARGASATRSVYRIEHSMNIPPWPKPRSGSRRARICCEDGRAGWRTFFPHAANRPRPRHQLCFRPRAHSPRAPLNTLISRTIQLAALAHRSTLAEDCRHCTENHRSKLYSSASVDG